MGITNLTESEHMRRTIDTVTESRLSSHERSAQNIESFLRHDGIGYERTDKLQSVIFDLEGPESGFRIVTDGQILSLLRNGKEVKSVGNRSELHPVDTLIKAMDQMLEESEITDENLTEEDSDRDRVIDDTLKRLAQLHTTLYATDRKLAYSIMQAITEINRGRHIKDPRNNND